MLNSIWLRQPYGFAPLYAREVTTYLNASARVFDSAQQVQNKLAKVCCLSAASIPWAWCQGAAAVPQINSFVKAHTNGRISTVLTQSQMASVDVGLLINVVFFKVRVATRLLH